MRPRAEARGNIRKRHGGAGPTKGFNEASRRSARKRLESRVLGLGAAGFNEASRRSARKRRRRRPHRPRRLAASMRPRAEARGNWTRVSGPTRGSGGFNEASRRSARKPRAGRIGALWRPSFNEASRRSARKRLRGRRSAADHEGFNEASRRSARKPRRGPPWRTKVAPASMRPRAEARGNHGVHQELRRRFRSFNEASRRSARKPRRRSRPCTTKSCFNEASRRSARKPDFASCEGRK